MRDGLIKTAVLTPNRKLADVKYNKDQICAMIRMAAGEGAKIMVFPELCITGCTCGDLFEQELLLNEAKKALLEIAENTAKTDAILFVGLPIEYQGQLYNAAAAICNGKILGLVPKTNILSNHSDFDQSSFAKGIQKPVVLRLDAEQEVPFGTDLLFVCPQIPELKIGVEIGEDLLALEAPGARHVVAGATVIVNLSSGIEMTGRGQFRRQWIGMTSSRFHCGYLYAAGGEGETTQSVVCSAHNMIVENGKILEEAERFRNESIISELDLQGLTAQRRRAGVRSRLAEGYEEIPFSLWLTDTTLTRQISAKPFVPMYPEELNRRCREILMIQALGIKQRMEQARCCSVIGVSEDPASVLALLATVRAFDLAGMDHRGIFAVLCANTKHKEVLRELIRALSCSLVDPTEETSPLSPAQTALRMNGMLIETGDLTDYVLGSGYFPEVDVPVYAANISVPDTLVLPMLRCYAQDCTREETAGALKRLLDLFDEDRETADLDFCLYYMLRFGFSPKKICRLAKYAFGEERSDEEIEKGLKSFYRRFFGQQQRNVFLPDGPTVGSISLSSQTGHRIPSDASARIWLDEAEQLGEGKEKKFSVDDIFGEDFEAFAQRYL